LWDLGRTSEAEEAYRKAIELDPNRHFPWQGLGHLLLETGPADEAERVWTKALELHQDALISCSVHILELRLERGVDPDQIIAQTCEWVVRSGRNPHTISVLAKFLVRAGINNALPIAETLAQEAFHKKKDSDTSEALSIVLGAIGKWGEAIDAIKTMLDA